MLCLLVPGLASQSFCAELGKTHRWSQDSMVAWVILSHTWGHTHQAWLTPAAHLPSPATCLHMPAASWHTPATCHMLHTPAARLPHATLPHTLALSTCAGADSTCLLRAG